MSRAYRIRVRETLRRVIRAEDHVSSQLELLQILPSDQMAELLAAELQKRGFARRNGRVARQHGDVTVTVELQTGTVTVGAESSETVKLQGEMHGRVYEDVGPGREQAEAALRRELINSLEQDADRQKERLQRQATDQLEAHLSELKSELDQAVNRATAEALKKKAAQIGQIKQITDDAETGSLTIVVEV